MKTCKKTDCNQKWGENKYGVEKERRGVVAIATTSTPTIAKIRDERERTEVAGFGITPKDLLLTAMRDAWEAARRKAGEVAELERQVMALEHEPATETLPLEEPRARHQHRQATKAHATAQLRARASILRLEIERDISLATSVARDVAPYVHPELINCSGEISQIATLIGQKI